MSWRLSCFVLLASFALAASTTLSSAANYLQNADFKDGLTNWAGDGVIVYLKPDNTEGSPNDPGVTPTLKLPLSSDRSQLVSQDIDTSDHPRNLFFRVAIFPSDDFRPSLQDGDYTKEFLGHQAGSYFRSRIVGTCNVDFWIRGGKEGEWLYYTANAGTVRTWSAVLHYFKDVPVRDDRTINFCVPPGQGAIYLRNPIASSIWEPGSSYAGPPPTASPSDATTNSPPTNAPTAETPAPVDHSAPVALTPDQQKAIVIITGDHAQGTGFLAQSPDGPVVFTNIHVISNNPNLKIQTNAGTQIPALSFKGAVDRDLVMISIKDNGYKYLTLPPDIGAVAQTGDEIITPGNSQGGGVTLNTDGKMLGMGPDRIEFDNPVYHGNSGGPVFHVKSGMVLGVVTEGVKVDVSDDLDKASFANRNSAISHAYRYFGLRIDNVPGWEAYEWNRFQDETSFLDDFEKRNQCLDCYLNAPDDNKPEDTVYLQDAKIVKANEAYFSRIAGADSAEKLDAQRQWLSDMYDIVDSDKDVIQNLKNFYSFDQMRAKDAIAFRKALRAELDDRSSNLSQLASMPRKE